MKMDVKNHRILQHSLEILEFVATSSRPVTFKEICDVTDLPKSTVHNLVLTLSNLDFLTKKPNYSEYSIGLKCFEVGNSYLSSNPFYSMAKETTADVSDRSNETAHFAILNHTDVVYLYKYESKQPLRIASHVGKRIPAHATAIGKALLSGYSDEEIRGLYQDQELLSLTPNTITSLEMLLDQVRQIRITQLAYETEESSPYIKCIATPIWNRQHATIAALSISMPVYRGEENMDQMAGILMDAKHQLESILTTLDI